MAQFCICLSDKTKLEIGKNFVDAVAGEYKCHGTATISDKKYSWKSTLSICDTEHALRQAAKREGKRVSNLMLQAL